VNVLEEEGEGAQRRLSLDFDLQQMLSNLQLSPISHTDIRSVSILGSNHHVVRLRRNTEFKC
jgi:hypothetical protein